MPFKDTSISAPTPQPLTDEDFLTKELFDKQTFDNSSFDFVALTDTSQLPQPMLPPLKQATYKACAQDFIVNEVLPLTFTDEGEHLWLHMQKLGMNTAYLAKLLSEWADIPLRDVGYSGLKDRHALTTQWFSLRLPKKQVPPNDFAHAALGENETVQILAQHWHNKKLNRGAHRANQFFITLRDIKIEADTLSVPVAQQSDKQPSPANPQQLIEQHLQHMSQHGVPNYFGSQRFGHGGNNIKEALRLFVQSPQKIKDRGKGKRKRPPREQNAMPLSAARSLIFNEILAARVRDGSWNQGLAGEVFNLDGSGSIFVTEQMDDTLRTRLATGDIHPTGVLWGIDNDKVNGPAAKLENDVVQQKPLLAQLAAGLQQRDIKAQRRALRLPIEELSCEWVDEQTLVLRFSLPTGSFATSVLANLVQQLHNSVVR